MTCLQYSFDTKLFKNYHEKRSKIMRSKQSHGFTLIELLIVIGVLSLLVVGLVVAINPQKQMKKARDAKRIAHLKQLATALDSYATVRNGVYPVEVQDSNDISAGCWGGWTVGNDDIAGNPFLQTLVTSGDLKSVPIETHTIEGTSPWPGWWSCSYRYIVVNIGSPSCRYAVLMTMLELAESRPEGIHADFRPPCVAAAGWGEGSPGQPDYVIFMPSN